MLVTDSVISVAGEAAGYRLIARRGRGGFADVWEAEAPGGFRVALRLVRSSPERRASELRAIEIMRDIRHPHLLPIFGAWSVGDLLIIGTELADRSLWDRFAEARGERLRGIPRRELLDYLTGVAVGIDCLNGPHHMVDGREGLGIQHRDLKPRNILLFGRCAKVGDFGMVRILDGSDASYVATWTLAYAAPEFFASRTARQSDQYGLAVTYCHMRGGALPFRGSVAEVMAGHMFGTPDLEGLPELERPIVARALAKSPEARWPDCRTFVEALGAVAAADGADAQDYLPGAGLAEFDGIDGSHPPNYDDLSACNSSGVSDFLLCSSQEDPTARERAEIEVLSDFQVLSEQEDETNEERQDPPALHWNGVFVPCAFALCAGVLAIVIFWPQGQREALRRRSVSVASTVAIATPAKQTPPTHPKVTQITSEERRVAARSSPIETKNPSTTLVKRQEPEQPTRRVEAAPAPAQERVAVTTRVPISGKREKPPRAETENPSTATAKRQDHKQSTRQVEAAQAQEHVTVATPALIPGKKEKPREERHSVAKPTPPPRTEDKPDSLALARTAYERARVHLVKGDYDDAVTASTEALRHDPAYGDAHLARAMAHHLSGRYSDALADYGAVIQQQPGRTRAYLLRARVHQVRGALDPALADLGAVIQLRPNDASTYIERGRVYHRAGAYDQALADFSAAIRLRPGDPLPFYHRGLVRYQTGDRPAAIADFDRTIALNPRRASAYRARSEAYARLGQYARAAADHDMFDRLVAGTSGSATPPEERSKNDGNRSVHEPRP